MSRQHLTVTILVALVASLATLLVADLASLRPAYGQDSTQASYVAMVAGPIVRDRSLPIVLVDTQQRTIMTYEYRFTGSYSKLVLTCARSFKYDRMLVDYNHENSANPERMSAGERGDNSVKDIMTAIGRMKPLE